MDKSRTATTIAALTVAVLAFGLVGCDNENDATPSTPTQATAPEAPADPVIDTAVETENGVYIDTIRSRIPDVVTVPDSALIELGGNICYGFDTGQTFDSIVVMGLTEGFSAYTIGSLIGVAIAVYCPNYFDEIPV